MFEQYHPAGDCPVCSEKDEHRQYKGARLGMGDSGIMCCSSRCCKHLDLWIKMGKVKVVRPQFGMPYIDTENNTVLVHQKYWCGKFPFEEIEIDHGKVALRTEIKRLTSK